MTEVFAPQSYCVVKVWEERTGENMRAKDIPIVKILGCVSRLGGVVSKSETDSTNHCLQDR